MVLLAQAFICLLLIPTPKLIAEEVLEEIYLDDNGEPTTTSADKKASEGETPAYEPSKWSYSLGLGGGSSSFFASFTANYNINQYVVPQVILTYSSIGIDQQKYTITELNYPILLYAANSSFFWPFIGAGPGYTRWSQSDEYGNYDTSSSITGIYFYGIRLKFTEHFSLIVQNRMTHFLNRPPVKTVSNRGTVDEFYTYQDSTISEFSYNFYVSF